MKDLLPQKTRWSQRAVARQMCADRATVKFYTETVATVIADYRAECPRNADGSIRSGMSLSPYQCWVVCRLIVMAREIKESLNGTSYRTVVKHTAYKMQSQLSKTAWMQSSSVAS